MFKIVNFCEGTRFTNEKHAVSIEIAKSKGLPLLKHHLLPRTKGFTLLTSITKNKSKFWIGFKSFITKNIQINKEKKGQTNIQSFFNKLINKSILKNLKKFHKKFNKYSYKKKLNLSKTIVSLNTEQTKDIRWRKSNIYTEQKISEIVKR